MRTEIELNLIPPAERGVGAEGPASAPAGAFAGELGRAVDALDRLQLEADGQADLVARGAGNLHEVALALEKADVAMRLAMKVRNKVVETYNEIMRMGV